MTMKTNSSAIIVPAPPVSTNSAATNSLAAADIRDIKAPVEIPSGWFWLWCVLGALGIALASYFAWRYWQKHRTRPKAEELIIPPHVRARRKLEQALALIYEARPFCISVSGTLRAYLEEAFALRAPERTTEEFLDELQSSALLSLSQKQLLGDFLVRCDLVKFAREEPAVDQLKELHASALRLIDETSVFLERPAPPTEPQPPMPPPANPPPSTASGEPSQPKPPPLTSRAVAGISVSVQTSEIANRKS
jgi:hypothetical protein